MISETSIFEMLSWKQDSPFKDSAQIKSKVIKKIFQNIDSQSIVNIDFIAESRFAAVELYCL